MGIYLAGRGRVVGSVCVRIGLALPASLRSLPFHAGPEIFALGLSDYEGGGGVLCGSADGGSEASLAGLRAGQFAREFFPGCRWPGSFHCVRNDGLFADDRLLV